MVNILPFFAREKEFDKREKKVSFLKDSQPTNDSDRPKRRKSLLSPKDKLKSNNKNPRSAKPFRPPKHKASLITMQVKPRSNQIKSAAVAAESQKSRFETATEILAQEILAQDALVEQSETEFWREQMIEARQRFYGVKGGRPRYGWESPNKPKPPNKASNTTSNNKSKSKTSPYRLKTQSKLANLRGLVRSQNLGANPARLAENSPTQSTREVWNTLYSKNQEIHSLRLSHQEMLEELRAHQVGLRHHKRALDEAKWESEECYQTLSLLNQLAGEGKHFDEKVWVERIQLRNRIRQLEKETQELRVKWEQCRQMLDSVDAIWFKEWEEKEVLRQRLKGAKAENERLNVQLKNVCRQQPESANGSRKSSPGRGEAEGPRVPPRISSLHWQNLARSASARREQFEREERSKTKFVSEPSESLELPQAQSEEDRLSPQPGQVWWTQLYGWPCYARVLTV
ncbi:hypothetical protein E2P81_ATG09285 [Venturia nashicola]|nr:hypothetical protein E2P81_ATG09285 [Venturia nashicola]